MKSLKQAVKLLLVAMMACSMLTAFASAASDEAVWLKLAQTESGAQVTVVTNASATDGVLELSYDGTKATFEGIEVDEDHVAMYSINNGEANTIRISWVAPEAYEAQEEGATLFLLSFSGKVTKKNVALEESSTIHNADGDEVPVSALVEEVEEPQEPAEEPGTGEVDTTELKQQIAKAEALDSSKYTADSYAAVSAALSDAKAVLASPKSTQAQIDAAAKALKDAMSALVEAASSATSTGGVKTGDAAKIGLAIGLAAAACAGGAALVVTRRRRDAK